MTLFTDADQILAKWHKNAEWGALRYFGECRGEPNGKADQVLDGVHPSWDKIVLRYDRLVAEANVKDPVIDSSWDSIVLRHNG